MDKEHLDCKESTVKPASKANGQSQPRSDDVSKMTRMMT